jgi:hypothetical protein
MPQTTFITEKELLYRLECPIRSCGQTTVQEESPILTCAETTAQWLITEIVDGRPPSLKETHERYDLEWNQTAYFRSREGIPQKDYDIRMREGIRACRRLRDIIWRCEILQPVTPYTLAIGDVVITGEYAVLCYPRRKKHAFALYLRYGGVKIRPLVPDVVSFARRLDLTDRWIDPSNRHWAIESIGVMHHWVARDFSLEHKINYSFSRDVLLGAVSVITGNPFPLPGDHCSSCPTRACRPDELVRTSASSTSIIRGNN